MTTEDVARFSALALRGEVLQALEAVNYVTMSAVQAQSLGAIIDGRDLLVQAETGSGKTAAFAIGILNKLDVAQFTTQALVICPTRELSEQVATEIRRLASGLANTRVVTLCGGKPMFDQLTSLKREPHIVVGTPGRLKKHLEKNLLNISDIQTLVLDEADRMLDMGFYDDIACILLDVNEQRQTLLFSATYPDDILDISRAIQNKPYEVRIAATHMADNIRQLFISTRESKKTEALLGVLGQYQAQRAIIFCNRKVTVQALHSALKEQGVAARPLHGDLDQRDRDEAIILFSNESISYLIATDVAARGLDITALPAVINYDVSRDPETHVHRIGRTGRAGLEGVAITLVTSGEVQHARAIEQLLETPLEYTELQASARNAAPVAKPTMCTLKINAVKKDKIRPGDIVGALTAESGFASGHIGKITVLAKVAFVAVDVSRGKEALRILTEGQIKGRRVRCGLVRV